MEISGVSCGLLLKVNNAIRRPNEPVFFCGAHRFLGLKELALVAEKGNLGAIDFTRGFGEMGVVHGLITSDCQSSDGAFSYSPIAHLAAS